MVEIRSIRRQRAPINNVYMTCCSSGSYFSSYNYDARRPLVDLSRLGSRRGGCSLRYHRHFHEITFTICSTNDQNSKPRDFFSFLFFRLIVFDVRKAEVIRSDDFE